jgi:hypothetical protein
VVGFPGVFRESPISFLFIRNLTGWYNDTVYFEEGKKLTRTSQRRKRGDYMPMSKKQMVKLNQVKKAKAEELSKQAAAGSQEAGKNLKKLEKKRR